MLVGFLLFGGLATVIDCSGGRIEVNGVSGAFGKQAQLSVKHMGNTLLRKPEEGTGLFLRPEICRNSTIRTFSLAALRSGLKSRFKKVWMI